jgi:uncharacterized repeat protein (TIGR01451 family)
LDAAQLVKQKLAHALRASAWEMWMNWVARTAYAAVMLGAAAVSFADMNTWTALGPEGGTVNKVVYSRSTPTTVFMIAEGGLYRSLDEGAHWQTVKTDFFNPPSDIDVDPTNQDRVYVVSASTPTLIVSTDGGATFSPINTFPNVGNVYQLEVAADGRTLYAAAGARFFRSADAGSSWEERSAISAVTLPIPSRMYVDPNDKDTVYALAHSGSNTNALYVTHDGAATWAALTAAAPAGYLFDFAFVSSPARIWLAAGNGIYVSSDAGQHFNPVVTPALAGGGALVSINPADATNLIIADGYGHLFRTNDEGAHWLNITDNTTVGAARTVAISPSQPSSHVLAGGSGGLSLSTIGGASWTPRNSGFKATRISGLSANPTADRIYLSALDGGVHYIDAGSLTTTEANNTALRKYPTPPSTFYVSALLAQDGAPGRLFASLDYHIASSLDGGSTWSLMGFPELPGLQARRLTSSPGNPQVILAGGFGPLYRSADGGAAWSAATTGLPANANANVVAFAPSDPLIAYAAPQVFGSPTSQSFGVYRSTNAGLTWSPANTGMSSQGIIALAVDPLDAQTLYASGDQKLWKSTNGGNSWSEMPAWPALSWGNVISLAIDPVHPQIVYAAGSFAVARSIDRGDTWELLREPGKLPFWFPEAILADPRRPQVVLVGTERSGVQQLTVAPDLSLELADAPSGTLQMGSAVTYRYSIGNLGPFHATGVKFTLQIPASAQAVSVESSVGACATVAQTITCSLDALRAGFSDAVTLHLTPSAAGTFQVTSTVEADQPDVAPGNNVHTSNATVAPVVTPPTPPVTSGGGGSSSGGSSGGGGGAMEPFGLGVLALALFSRLRRRRLLASAPSAEI